MTPSIAAIKMLRRAYFQQKLIHPKRYAKSATVYRLLNKNNPMMLIVKIRKLKIILEPK